VPRKLKGRLGGEAFPAKEGGGGWTALDSQGGAPEEGKKKKKKKGDANSDSQAKRKKLFDEKPPRTRIPQRGGGKCEEAESMKEKKDLFHCIERVCGKDRNYADRA